MRLALDTAFSACSVALADSRGKILGQAHLEQKRGQAETLAPMVEKVLKEAGIKPQKISEIVVNTGPGTFAGVRIATAFARALALSTASKTIGINAFEALAGSLVLKEKAQDGDYVLALVPAKRGEVSAALFTIEKGRPKSLAPPETRKIEKLAAYTGDRKVIAAGPELKTLLGGLTGPDFQKSHSFWPRAVELLEVARLLGKKGQKGKLSPFYLRPPDAKPQNSGSFSL